MVNNNIKYVINSYNSSLDKKFRQNYQLSDSNRKILDIFKTSDGRTEIDVCCVYKYKYKYKSRQYNQNRYNLVVEDIIGLDQQTEKDFCLPVFAIQDKNFVEKLSIYHDWLFFSCKYPIIIDGNIMPDLRKKYVLVSNLDKVELYLNMLIGTLNEYFETNNLKYIDYCRKIQYSMNYILIPERHTLSNLLNKKNTLYQLIINKNNTESDANNYKTFLDNITASQYYWILYHLIIESEIICKNINNLISIDLLIFGLLTQNCFTDQNSNQIGCRYEGIQDNILKIILDYEIKNIRKINLDGYTEMDKLVEDLQNLIPIENLRYWTLLIKISQVMNENYNNFTNLIENLKENLTENDKILNFCLMICPNKCINTKIIAEYILCTIQGIDNHPLYLSDTPELFKLLNKNKFMQISKVNTYKQNIVLAVSVWPEFLKQVNCVNLNLIHSGKSHIYKEWIIKLAEKGDDLHLELLKDFINNGNSIKPPLLGIRRTITLILRYAPLSSPIIFYYLNLMPKLINDLSYIRYGYSKKN